MATLRNLRAYVPGTNASTTEDYASYDTASNDSGNAILRKINLNVDIATQNELNEAFVTLSNAITATGTDWKAADQQLSADLKAWAKGDELSGALHTEVTNEATARETADQAIRDSLSAYALSTTVADAYKVTVEKDATATEGYAATYTVKQGGTAVEVKINIPKDFLVKSAELCTVTVADEPYAGAKVGDKYIDFTINTADASETAQHIYLPVNDLVDVYTGAETDTATVTVGDDNSISVAVKDYVSKTYVDGVSSAISTAFEPRVAANEAVSRFVAGMSATWGGGGTAIQSVAGDNVYLTATTDENKNVTVAATNDLCTAVDLAHSAVQSVAVDGTYLTANRPDDQVNINPTDKLTAAVAAAETALQSISKGTDGTYVTTTIGTKDSNKDQTVGVAVTVAALTAGTNGLAEATDVKQYVDGKITDLSVSAAGDAYVEASSTGKEITVAAADRTKAAIDKVEAASTDWDEVSAKADLTALTAEATARENADSALSTAIDNLSATYASKTTVDNAASTLESTLSAAKAVTAYVDIDEIIEELEALKAVVRTFATSLKTA